MSEFRPIKFLKDMPAMSNTRVIPDPRNDQGAYRWYTVVKDTAGQLFLHTHYSAMYQIIHHIYVLSCQFIPEREGEAGVLFDYRIYEGYLEDPLSNPSGIINVAHYGNRISDEIGYLRGLGYEPYWLSEEDEEDAVYLEDEEERG